jgi:hypothetical protein
MMEAAANSFDIFWIAVVFEVFFESIDFDWCHDFEKVRTASNCIVGCCIQAIQGRWLW